MVGLACNSCRDNRAHYFCIYAFDKVVKSGIGMNFDLALLKEGLKEFNSSFSRTNVRTRNYQIINMSRPSAKETLLKCVVNLNSCNV